MAKKLLQYLPYLYRDYAEFQGICNGAQPCFNAAWKAAESLLDEQYIPGASGIGLERWESMLGIAVSADDSIETRRARILELLRRSRTPYTITWLREWLQQQGENFTAEVEDYTVRVNFEDADLDTDLDGAAAFLEKVLPENLVYGEIRTRNLAYDLPVTGSGGCIWSSSALPEIEAGSGVLGDFVLGSDVLG